MLDKSSRIGVLESFNIFNSTDEEVYFYFSMEENLYFILPKEDENEFCTHVRKLDAKKRVFIPKDILKEYGVKHIKLGKKHGKLYLVPVFPHQKPE